MFISKLATVHQISLVPRPLRSRSLLALILLSTAALAQSATLEGQVVALADGDTLTVLDAAKTQHKVRVAGIDAPEKRQPFGDASRKQLSALVFRKQVVVEWQKTDRYGRIVGKVLVGGVDAGLAQVNTGLAWHYKAYAREQSAADRIAYAAAEDDARANRSGLWSQDGPVAPWEFRRGVTGTPQ